MIYKTIYKLKNEQHQPKRQTMIYKTAAHSLVYILFCISLFVFWVGAAHSLVYILFCISLFVFWVGAAHSLILFVVLC
jgi:uncharacterized membrane protein